MIPLRLRLKNFLSYREPGEPLDFRSFQIACLCGENGHGKSTLLDAITWALWGRARAKTEDELIHHGQTDMEVEFEFLLGDSRYRVIRKRRRGGPTAVELHQWIGEQFQTISGNSLRETERTIIQLLHLDYETFVNSSFLLQGKADSFTVSPPSKRKELLGEILGLGLYDQLEQCAKEAARSRKEAVAVLDARIADFDRQLEQEPIYRARRDEFAIEAARLREEVTLLDEEVQHQQHRLQRCLDARQQVDRLERENAGERDHQAKSQRRLTELRGWIERAEEILSRREEIEDGYARYLEARQVIDEQSQKAAELTALQQERHRLAGVIERETARLKQQRSHLAGKIDQLTTQLVDATEFETEIAQRAAHVEQALARRAALDERKTQLQRLAEQVGQFVAEQKQLRQHMDDLKGRIEALRGMARCETCGQPITPAARDEQIQRLESDGKQLGDRFRALRAALEQLEVRRAAEQRALTREETEIQHILDTDGPRLAQLRERQDLAAKAAAAIEQLRPRLAALDETLAAQRVAEHEQQALARIDERIAALAFDPAALQAARERADTFQPFVDRKRELDHAVDQIERWRTHATEVEFEIAKAERRIAQREEELHKLRAQAAELERVEQHLEQIRRMLGDQRQAYQYAELQRARYEQVLASCEQVRLQRVAAEAERAQAAREQGIYEDLTRAFGKGGVQAMIIESVLPEIEEDANELLARMTDGRMRLALATRRETQQGKTVETLLIQISDELGLRNYELFSGGEAFRVNFALRIALAKLLARRAGARLETVVIDEGFGTQDASGRDRLVEAIRSIEQDFAKIVVITHIDELKEAFPTRIEVTKGPEGSRFALLQR